MDLAHGALLASASKCAPAHDTVVAALEAGAASRAPLVTFHGVKAGPVTLDARDVLDGAVLWASAVSRSGVSKGDRVLLLLPTGETFVTALLGAMLCGAAPVPLASPMTFGSMEPFLRNLVAIIDDACPKVIVTHARAVDAMRTAGIGRQDLVVLTEKDRPDASGLGDIRWPSIGGADPALVT